MVSCALPLSNCGGAGWRRRKSVSARRCPRFSASSKRNCSGWAAPRRRGRNCPHRMKNWMLSCGTGRRSPGTRVALVGRMDFIGPRGFNAFAISEASIFERSAFPADDLSHGPPAGHYTLSPMFLASCSEAGFFGRSAFPALKLSPGASGGSLSLSPKKVTKESAPDRCAVQSQKKKRDWPVPCAPRLWRASQTGHPWPVCEGFGILPRPAPNRRGLTSATSCGARRSYTGIQKHKATSTAQGNIKSTQLQSRHSRAGGKVDSHSKCNT